MRSKVGSADQLQVPRILREIVERLCFDSFYSSIAQTLGLPWCHVRQFSSHTTSELKVNLYPRAVGAKVQYNKLKVAGSGGEHPIEREYNLGCKSCTEAQLNRWQARELDH